MNALGLVVLVAAGMLGADLPEGFVLPAPPGPHVTKAAESSQRTSDFPSGTPLIATSYFYWYDAETKAHVIDHDGTDALTDHPPTLEGFSYHNVDWHARQLADMIGAGIDVVLPVYWGTPLGDFSFSDAGLPKLVAARQKVVDTGKKPPAVGMFYDTTTLRHNGGDYHVDLTTEAGRLWFYGSIRNFFSLVPPEHRARIDGKPLLFLYASAFAKNVDERLFPAVRTMFRRDFGTDLYIVKMRGWPGRADSEYQWGAALRPQLLETAGIGPGYDHSAVPGRTPLVRRRDGGRFYEFAWQRLLGMDPGTRPWLVHLETWNEFHEGTEICETAEYGRQYIEMTRRFADRFHARERIDSSSLSGARKILFASPEESQGLWVVPQPDGDGPVVETELAAKKAWQTKKNRHSPVARYMYFEVEDYFLYDGDESIEVRVGYFDAGPAEFRIQYDSRDPKLTGLAQQFREGPGQPIEDTRVWREATFVIPHARFAGRSNGADFRLACAGEDLVVSHVAVRRTERDAEKE
jgi:hypothetical protein